ncbi:unnamed protein product [Didymodactylos carnosus]|uniref:CABIT domain-containing protein n=1 Tax=Didymodactylos carnosus TaxID=1234261 RepID=A0A813PBE2_9BILA|nr:unnamed protein product [Didymodactylos carnosus]CAF1144813.1 unnamed protein product [Didymodactylos carnosus]CAF3531430.1 unnamed protein product [Didymodactylos carnosus]CAF3945127.1 unnamed protein product [Didymodactylos carnosus]
MERIRWSEKRIPFKNIIENSLIPKPALVQIGQKTIVVGEKINGEFIMASPCKVVGNRFDVMEQEIVLSSKHTGLWRVISKSSSKKEESIHRLTVRDLETLYQRDKNHQRANPRSFICIRDVEAFELVIRTGDPSTVDGRRIDRRTKQIEEDTEFEITSGGEIEYTPSEGERTSQDYAFVPKKKQGLILSLLLPGIVEQEQLVRNRTLRALFCRTKGETRSRHFLLEVNEQPCEIRPIASEGSVELRYLHSTQNLYEYLHSHSSDTALYVKLLRGDPPIKAVEFDGYLVLKSVLNGDKVPICRTQDLEITLVSPDIPVQVRLPTKQEHYWRTLSEVRAAELQCMQLALALLARHESEMYINNESGYNGDLSMIQSTQNPEELKKHIEECERIFASPAAKTKSGDTLTRKPTDSRNKSTNVINPPLASSNETTGQPIHATSDKLYKSSNTSQQTVNQKHSRNIAEAPKTLIAKQSTTKTSTTSTSYTNTSQNVPNQMPKQSDGFYDRFNRLTIKDKTTSSSIKNPNFLERQNSKS